MNLKLMLRLGLALLAAGLAGCAPKVRTGEPSSTPAAASAAPVLPEPPPAPAAGAAPEAPLPLPSRPTGSASLAATAPQPTAAPTPQPAPSDNGAQDPLPPMVSLQLFPWTTGNSAQLLVNGTAAFPAIFAAAEKAEKSLLVESYIFGDDEIGRRMVDLMIRKAKAGVECRLIIDGLGSEAFPPDLLDKLAAERRGDYFVFRPVHFFNKIWMPVSSLRDHRKIVVVDGRVAFLGGINMAADESDWRDFMVRIEGPAVGSVTRLFASEWARGDAKERLAGDAYFPALEPVGKLNIRVLGNQARKTRWEIYAAYRDALRRAKREVIIANAYFLPDQRIRRELVKAVRRGVRVILLLPAKSDVPLVQAASEFHFRSYLKRGLEIFLYSERPLHAKVAVIDGHWLTVGSYNLDHQSLRNNLEITAVIDDPALGLTLRNELVRDLYKSKALTLNDWDKRPWSQKLRCRWWAVWSKLM